MEASSFALVVSSLVALMSTSYFSFLVIRHLKGKPLGMQTFLDKCLLEAMLGYQIFSWLANLTIVFGIVNPGSLNELQCRLMSTAILASSFAWHLSTLFFFIVKYLTIYYCLDQWINFDEHNFAVILRITIWSLALFLSLLDFGWCSNVDKFVMTHLMYTGKFALHLSVFELYGFFAPFTSTTMLVTGVLMYLKVEAEARKMDIIRYFLSHST